MITEVMTLLIAVGAIMIFVVWNQGKKRQQKAEERREVEETTGRLKQEIEKTANDVISRMENQVSGIEDLLDESEKNRTVLEGRVAELRKLLKRSEGQSTEIRDLLAKLEETGDTVEELQRRLEAAEKRIAMSMQIPMQMPMQSPMLPMSSVPPMNTPMTTPMMPPMMNQPMMTTPLPNVPSPISPPPILSSRQNLITETKVGTADTNAPAPTATEPAKAETPAPTKDAAPKPKKMDKAEMKKALEKASLEQDKAEPKDFAKVLEKSMENSAAAAKSEVKVPNVPDRRSIIVSSHSNQPAALVNTNRPVKIESTRTRAAAPSSVAERRAAATAKEADNAPVNNSVKIKNMLLEGMSVEDIARTTGLGRGAVELVQEMTRRKLERK